MGSFELVLNLVLTMQVYLLSQVLIIPGTYYPRYLLFEVHYTCGKKVQCLKIRELELVTP